MTAAVLPHVSEIVVSGRRNECFDIIREHSSTRKQIIPTTAELGMGFFPSAPVQVDVGGATVFVLGVERFEKL